MTTLEYYQRFSHTTRSFDLTRPVDNDLKLKINEIITKEWADWSSACIIEDKDVIEQIYQISDLPDETHLGIKYTPRKNSQLLAPMLILLAPSEETEQYTSYFAGKTYSKIGMAAMKAGYNTSFCICYDRDRAKSIIFPDNTTIGKLGICSIIMGIGHILPGTTTQQDVRQNIITGSQHKAHKDYITVIE
jgi:hypothetical protein